MSLSDPNIFIFYLLVLSSYPNLVLPMCSPCPPNPCYRPRPPCYSPAPQPQICPQISCPPQYCPPPPICPPPPPPPPCPPPPPIPICPPRIQCPMPMPSLCPCPRTLTSFQPPCPFRVGICGGGGLLPPMPSYPPLQTPQSTGCGESPQPPPSSGGGCSPPPSPGPATNDCCCGCPSPCRFRRRRVAAYAARSKPMLIDPSCNNRALASLMQENMTDEVSESKRLIQRAAQNLLRGKFNVICGIGVFSYIAHTELFCQQSANNITCYAFKPL